MDVSTSWHSANADHFARRSGSAFDNLQWFCETHSKAFDGIEYVLVVDDDVIIEPESIERAVRTARVLKLPASTPSRLWNGNNSDCPLTCRPRAAGRLDEHAGGVEFSRRIDSKCSIFEMDVIKKHFARCRINAIEAGCVQRHAEMETFEIDAFAILHNVAYRTTSASGHESKCTQTKPMILSSTSNFSSSSPECWLPRPRIRCINLPRATQRRTSFARRWIDELNFPVEFFDAIDRRDIEAGRSYFQYDEVAVQKRLGRGLSYGEIACATSHALVLLEEMEFCGPEGLIVFEDDCIPLAGAEEIYERICAAVTALKGVEAIGLQRPIGRLRGDLMEGGAIRVKSPPWGTYATYYSPSGLRRAAELLAKLECPADWIWRDFAARNALALLSPPIADHDETSGTYVGNDFRGRKRQYMP